jgi:hypothetical protein
VICCLVGGALLAVLARAARAGRDRNGGDLRLPLAALFGFTVGMFVLELFVTVLGPFGVVRTTGALAAGLALLAVPAVVAVATVAAGAANGLADRRGTTVLALTVTAGALAAEELDLHLLDLHEPRTAVGWAVVHLAVVAILIGGLVVRRYAGCERADCCAEEQVERASCP